MNRAIVAIVVLVTAFLAAAPVRAQIVIDGTRDAGYLATRWIQGVPTSAGDNAQAGVPAPGDPQSVTTGAEFKIPLSALGNPTLTTHLRLAGLIVSSDYVQASNQVVGSLLCDATALGPTRGVRFDLLGSPTSNKQFVVIGAGKDEPPPVIDGTLDAGYGAPLFLQAASAEWGDSTSGQLDYAPASEIDAVYVVRTLTDLYVFVAGNLSTDLSRLVLFFDSKGAGGQNQL
ncbi:MAG: hypothetical protein JNL50_13450, partial [Phycisphaerae bacterium]|nr:hypothetical protein [Phycisphaerae bacterium]